MFFLSRNFVNVLYKNVLILCRKAMVNNVQLFNRLWRNEMKIKKNKGKMVLLK